MEMMQNVRPLQSMRQHQFLVGQQLHRAPVGDDLTVIENNCPRTQFDRQFQIVGDSGVVVLPVITIRPTLFRTRLACRLLKPPVPYFEIFAGVERV